MSDTERQAPTVGRATSLESRRLAPPRQERAAPPASEESLLREIIDRMDDIDRRTMPAPGMIIEWLEIKKFAEEAVKSDMVPDAYKGKPMMAAIAIQMGLELGLTPMMALNSIAVINGKPGVYGDAMPGLCWRSGRVASVREWHEGEGDDRVAHCEVYRKGNPHPFKAEFGVSDAITAGLWSPEAQIERKDRDAKPYTKKNDAAWHRHWKIMMKWRARIAFRDAFPDVLRGLLMVEELEDMEPSREAAPPVTHQPSGSALYRLEERLTATDGAASASTSGAGGGHQGETPEPDENDAPGAKSSDEKTPSDGGFSEAAADAAPRDGKSSDPAAAKTEPQTEGQGVSENVMTADGTQTLRQWYIGTNLQAKMAKRPEQVQTILDSEPYLDNLAIAYRVHRETAEKLDDFLKDRVGFLRQAPPHG